MVVGSSALKCDCTGLKYSSLCAGSDWNWFDSTADMGFLLFIFLYIFWDIYIYSLALNFLFHFLPCILLAHLTNCFKLKYYMYIFYIISWIPLIILFVNPQYHVNRLWCLDNMDLHTVILTRVKILYTPLVVLDKVRFLFLPWTCMCPSPNSTFFCFLPFDLFFILTCSRCRLTTASESRLRHYRWVVWCQWPAWCFHSFKSFKSQLAFRVVLFWLPWKWGSESLCVVSHVEVFVYYVREEECMMLPLGL